MSPVVFGFFLVYVFDAFVGLLLGAVIMSKIFQFPRSPAFNRRPT